MEKVVLVAAAGISILCGLILLLWIVQTMWGKRRGSGRMAAATVFMCWGVWQVYVLNPTFGADLAYSVAPIAALSVLRFFSGLPGILLASCRLRGQT